MSEYNVIKQELVRHMHQLPTEDAAKQAVIKEEAPTQTLIPIGRAIVQFKRLLLFVYQAAE